MLILNNYKVKKNYKIMYLNGMVYCNIKLIKLPRISVRLWFHFHFETRTNRLVCNYESVCNEGAGTFNKIHSCTFYKI